jgi:hypothetical protein
MRETESMKGEQIKMTKLISDKIDLKTKFVIRDKEGYFMLKMVYQNIAIMSTYVHICT